MTTRILPDLQRLHIWLRMGIPKRWAALDRAAREKTACEALALKPVTLRTLIAQHPEIDIAFGPTRNGRAPVPKAVRESAAVKLRRWIKDELPANWHSLTRQEQEAIVARELGVTAVYTRQLISRYSDIRSGFSAAARGRKPGSSVQAASRTGTRPAAASQRTVDKILLLAQSLSLDELVIVSKSIRKLLQHSLSDVEKRLNGAYD